MKETPQYSWDWLETVYKNKDWVLTRYYDESIDSHVYEFDCEGVCVYADDLQGLFLLIQAETFKQ